MNIPKDPVMLLSYINTQLRDHYSYLDDLVKSLSLNKDELISSLKNIQYEYNESRNQFV